MQSTSALNDWPFTHSLPTLTAPPEGPSHRPGQGHKPGVGLLASMRISGPRGHLQGSTQVGHCISQLGPQEESPGSITAQPASHRWAALGQVLASGAPGALMGFGGWQERTFAKNFHALALS